MRRILPAILVALLALASPAAATTAEQVARLHERHHHHQWRGGEGTAGHTWRQYQREARQIDAYVRAVAVQRMRRCGAEPHCAVQLASFLTGAPWGLVSAVVGCESGWNPSAANSASSAGGLFQFLSGTWASLAPGWGMGGHSRFEVWPAALVGSGTIAQGGISHWAASSACWS